MIFRRPSKPISFSLSRSIGYGRTARNSSTRLIAVFGVTGVLIVVGTFWRAPLSGALWRMLEPVAFVRDGFVQAGLFVSSGFRSSRALSTENDALRGEVADMQQKVADRDALYQENLTLKQQYSREDFDVSHPVLAGIVVRPPQLPYDLLINDAGTDHGLNPGNLVSVGSGVIGTIMEMYPNNARVQLFSSAGRETGGMLDGAFVTVEGQGSGAMMIRLPTGVSAAVGDPVTLAGISGGVFGIVTRIETSASSALKSVYLRAPADVFAIKFVMVDSDMKHVFKVDQFLNASTSATTTSATTTPSVQGSGARDAAISPDATTTVSTTDTGAAASSTGKPAKKNTVKKRQ